MKQQQLARNLAFFSLGLGVVGLLAPRRLAGWIGVPEGHENTLRLLGLREISSGLGIMQGNAAYFLWSRVAGDVMDLALLGTAYRSSRADRDRLRVAIGAVAGVTIIDVIASAMATRNPAEPGWRDRRPMSERGALEFEGAEESSRALPPARESQRGEGDTAPQREPQRAERMGDARGEGAAPGQPELTESARAAAAPAGLP